MKGLFYALALMFLLVGAEAGEAVELRAGGGQLYTKDEKIEANPNQFFVEVGLPVGGIFTAGVGARYIKVSKITDTLYVSSGDAIGSSGSTFASFTRQISAFGGYAWGMVSFKMGDETAIVPFGQIATGFHIAYPLSRMTYTEGGSEQSIVLESKSPSDKVAFLMGTAGLEVRFSKVGVFLQGSYIESGKIDYDGFEFSGIPLAPGGSIDPSGWQVFLGVALH